MQVLLRNGIAQLLNFMAIPQEIIATAITDLDVITLTKTKDRSLVGNLTALVDAYLDGVDRGGGLPRLDLTELILNINNRPQRRLAWASPVEISSELLGAGGRSA